MFTIKVLIYLRLDVNTIAANASKIDGMLAVDELAESVETNDH